uniref:Uncharacterized protein n=1 Tax=Oryza barthii TaxID=65489 RepID=A0A0D3EKX9_9ORYZ
MCRRWRKPCRAFGRFDDDDAIGAISLLECIVMALSYLPHKSLGENLAPASDERRRRYASSWGRRFEECRCGGEVCTAGRLGGKLGNDNTSSTTQKFHRI